MKPTSIVTILACALALGSALASPCAHACGMSVRLAPEEQAKPTPVQEVAAAERLLDAGQPGLAAKKIFATYANVRAEEAGKDPLRTRALRVFALAVARADGTVALRERETWSRNANLEWAAQALREIDQKRPNDPSVQADLGEALSHLGYAKNEAFKILDGLAQKDLVGSPSAYAVLSRLRAERGDAGGAALAMKRCEGMATTPAICGTTKTAAVTAPGRALVAAR